MQKDVEVKRRGKEKDQGKDLADKYARMYGRHHHRHMAQHITTHQYHTTDLHRHCFPQPPKKKKRKENPPASVFLPLYVCLFPHPHPFKSNPGSQGIIPRRTSKCHRITSMPPQRCSFFLQCTLFHRNIQKDTSKQALCSPSSNHTIHGSPSCLTVLGPSLCAHSGGQLVGSCRFPSKLYKQSKLEVQPSLEAKPL